MQWILFVLTCSLPFCQIHPLFHTKTMCPTPFKIKHIEFCVRACTIHILLDTWPSVESDLCASVCTFKKMESHSQQIPTANSSLVRMGTPTFPLCDRIFDWPDRLQGLSTSVSSYVQLSCSLQKMLFPLQVHRIFPPPRPQWTLSLGRRVWDVHVPSGAEWPTTSSSLYHGRFRSPVNHYMLQREENCI